MYLTCILLCLWGALLSGLFGRKLGVKGSQFLTISCVSITTFLVVFIFMEVSLNHIPVEIKLFKWLDSELLSVLWSFNFDSLTSSMLIPVIVVSNLVHLYSVSYMSNDPHNQRFFSYLSLFTFMMIILVTSNNYLVMFVGWEGVGVCSYLLVSFWFTRVAANQSSIAAFLTNRVGDCLLTVGMFIIIWISGSLDYSILFSISSYINENIILFISICLLIGAMAKSSQIGLHVWLPMAMEGPTPVSALIHAATMVTAGVYLLIRSSPVIEYSDTILLVCLWLGGLTSLSSSLIGFFQQDIKKIIAYSTMSQLGMMVIAIGLSSYNVALFHLINHAFYKALLFLGAGSIIHGMHDNQDLRKYGALKLYMPLTYTVIAIASLSLIAFPFLSGYYSKDFILESLFGDYYFSSISVYFLAYIGATFTTLYSIKILYLTFLSNPNGSFIDYKNVHEGNWFMVTPLIILSIFSIFFGFVSRDLYIGLGTDLFIDNSIFINFKNETVIDTEFGVPVIFKLLPLISTLSVSFLFIYYHENIVFYNFVKYLESNKFYFYVYSYFNQKLFIELFYNKYISEFIFNVGGKTTKILDKGSIEYVGPTGLEWLFEKLSSSLSKLDKGITPLYALYILLGFTLYMLLFSNKINSELLIILFFTLSIYF